MDKITKYLLGFVICAILSQGVCGAISTKAAVNANTSDTRWYPDSYVFWTSASDDYTLITPVRPKTNTSSVYIFYDRGTIPYVLAEAHVKEGNVTYNATYPNAHNNYQYYYFVAYGQEREIYNTVVEDGYIFTCLHINTAPSATSINGLWSPDCAGSYE